MVDFHDVDNSKGIIHILKGEVRTAFVEYMLVWEKLVWSYLSPEETQQLKECRTLLKQGPLTRLEFLVGVSGGTGTRFLARRRKEPQFPQHPEVEGGAIWVYDLLAVKTNGRPWRIVRKRTKAE